MFHDVGSSLFHYPYLHWFPENITTPRACTDHSHPYSSSLFTPPPLPPPHYFPCHVDRHLATRPPRHHNNFVHNLLQAHKPRLPRNNSHPPPPPLPINHPKHTLTYNSSYYLLTKQIPQCKQNTSRHHPTHNPIILQSLLTNLINQSIQPRDMSGNHTHRTRNIP